MFQHHHGVFADVSCGLHQECGSKWVGAKDSTRVKMRSCFVGFKTFKEIRNLIQRQDQYTIYAGLVEVVTENRVPNITLLSYLFCFPITLFEQTDEKTMYAHIEDSLALIQTRQLIYSLNFDFYLLIFMKYNWRLFILIPKY